MVQQSLRPEVQQNNKKASTVVPVVMEARDLSVYYGAFRAVRDVNLVVPQNRITALIGPSGCGKSTMLRSLNRMNDLIASTHHLSMPCGSPICKRRRFASRHLRSGRSCQGL